MDQTRRARRYGYPRLWSIVVPTDTASLMTQATPLVSVATFVDTIFAPEVNSVVPGTHVARRSTAVKRSIFVCTRTSSAVAGAPGAVAALAATLASRSEQSYLIHGTKGGDIWIVGNNATSLRHGMYDYLARVGVKYLLPHPAWRVSSARGSLETVDSEVMSPAVSGFGWDGNGGLGSGTLPPIPGRQASIDNWNAWKQQTRNPSEVLSGFGDGDEGFTVARQQELDNDHSMLAWRLAPVAKRGFSESGNYPTGDCAGMANTLAKLCSTHTGASGTGSYPAAPAGPDVWTAQAALAWTESCVVNPPGGPLTPDPGPDSATNPSLNYTAYDGLHKLYCEHKRDRACVLINTYGYPHPQTRFVSCQSNDGANFCQCDRCRDLLRNGPYSAYLTIAQLSQDASDSDKEYHRLNLAGARIADWFQHATICPGVGRLAYASAVAPPSIPIWQKSATVLLYATALNARALPSEMIEQWLAKQSGNAWGAFTLGISPQWLTDNTNFAAPRWPSAKIGADYLAKWISDGFTLVNAQTGYSSMTMGTLFRVLSELCWRPTVDIVGLCNELTDALGPAGPAVKAMFDRWAQWYEHSPQELAVSFRDVQIAQAALDAAADPVTHEGRATIQWRLDHVRMFVEWQRRYCEYLAANDDYDRGRVTASGTSPPAVVLSGVRTAPSLVKIEVEVGGTTFKWTKNADASTVVWEATGVTIPTTGTRQATLTGTGRVATFPAGTYLAGQAWDETPNKTALITATDRALEWLWKCGAGRTSTDAGSNIIHSDRIADKLYARIAHPYSNSKVGTSPPNITVSAIAAGAGLKPTAGTVYVEIECNGAGARGVATIRSRVNGGSWTTDTTAASVTIVAAGITVTCQNLTYSTDNKWYITIDPNLSKWNIYDPSASAGWATLFAPSKGAIDTLVTSGVAAYAPVSGVSRRVFDETSFQSFDPSVGTTLRAGPKYSTPHAYVIKKPAGSVTIKLKSLGLSSSTAGLPVRVLLKNNTTNATLQEWAFTPSTSGAGTLTNDIVLTQPAGIYRLVVVDCAPTSTLGWIETPENVACVHVNDWFDSVAATTRGFSATDHQYFYVPSGETKVLMVFRQGTGNGITPVQFFNPSGTPVTTTYQAPNQWVCNVGAGEDNAAWSFTGLYPFDNFSPVFFWNCPARLAPSSRQLLIP